MPAIVAVTLRLPAELGERFYAVVPAGSRNAWLVRVVEQALSGEPSGATPPAERASEALPRARSAAPAEEPSKPLPHYNEGDTLPVAKSQTFPTDAFRRSSSQAKRDVQPVPKKG